VPTAWGVLFAGRDRSRT